MDVANISRTVLLSNSAMVPKTYFKDGCITTPNTFFFVNTSWDNEMMDFVRCNISDKYVTLPMNMFTNAGVQNHQILSITFNMLYNIRMVNSTSDWFILDDEYELPKEDNMSFISK